MLSYFFKKIRTLNTPQIPGEGQPFGVLGFASARDIDDHLFTNYDSALGGM